jgi:cytochrome c oxidase cbb3-type subunit 3
MMKFINYLESITGISIYPLVSLVLFTVFFAVVALYVFTADKRAMERKSHMPLDDH